MVLGGIPQSLYVSGIWQSFVAIPRQKCIWTFFDYRKWFSGPKTHINNFYYLFCSPLATSPIFTFCSHSISIFFFDPSFHRPHCKTSRVSPQSRKALSYLLQFTFCNDAKTLVKCPKDSGCCTPEENVCQSSLRLGYENEAVPLRKTRYLMKSLAYIFSFVKNVQAPEPLSV